MPAAALSLILGLVLVALPSPPLPLAERGAGVAQAQPAGGQAVTAPLPPRRPADLAGIAAPAAPSANAPSLSAPSPNAPLRLTPDAAPRAPLPPPPAVTPAAASAAVPASAPAGPLSDEAAVAKVNAYLNSFRTLIADFVQFGADGRRYEGKLYLERPGRMRFEYEPPATIEVIADGTTVAVRDRRLATQDNYLISQTPLKFLLKERIDLMRDVKVTRVQSAADRIRITLEDRSTLGGTSRITLHFDPVANRLTQWVIVDPQGYETSVQVANLDTARRPDPALFRINLEIIRESNR